MKKFPFYRQLDAMDCGPTCLRMVSKHHGKSYSLQYLRDRSYLDREGVSLKGISEAAESIGFRTMAVKVSYGNNPKEPCLLAAPLPAIAHWNQNHFIVVYKVTKDNVWIADPGAGKFKLPRKEFEKHWLSDQDKAINWDEQVDLDYFTTNLISYVEAKQFNIGLNRKVCLNKYGEVKNYLTHIESFGNILEDNLMEIIEKPSFQQKWKVSNDLIEHCNICEFRYCCLSNSDLKHKDNKWYKLNYCNDKTLN